MPITAEGIEELKAEGFPLFYGALGENLTTRGIDRHAMRPGQRYRVGDVLIELTRFREPCYQLSPYGPGIQTALHGSRAGLYASVLRAGAIRSGDTIELLEELA